MAASTSIDEPARLEALRQYHILDTPRERAFDDLVWLAAQICEVPIALVSLVDQHRLWFKGSHGVKITETPRQDSFCTHAILTAPELLIVPDAAKDPRFAHNSLVTGEPGIRFYAGAPLVTPEGHAIGTLCVLDYRPRQLNDCRRNALRILSRQVIQQLELRRRLAELGYVSGQLAETNAELESFSHAISHDLRGPLRATTSFAQILQARHARQLDARGSELLREIQHNGERSAEMLDAFLRLLRLKQQPLHRTEVDMTQLAESALREVQMQSSGLPAQFILHPLPPACGDKALIAQVWINLLSNALKFSQQRSPPRIEVGAQEEADRLVYFVKDNGTGFAMNEASRLWTAFHRLHGQEVEGSGLGLSIVRRIILRHGGQVWAEGEPNQGATFYFALPNAAAEVPIQQAA
ncbi:MAG TPA: ATP-binding protein [Candidatus Sulfotelmatobacter sp.]|nr:ATP-binding protein [Candidatus Sulfotelmatobacter sp.]HWI58897.1 ATP-binding protein [Bacillota bacterium]